MVTLLLGVFYFFLETSILFSTVAVPIYIPINNIQGFPFFHTLCHICVLFDASHSDKCELIPHCGFDLHFPND